MLGRKDPNQNESFNGMIWDRVPKVFVGSQVFSLGLYYAVAHFNVGATATERVLENMKIKPGKFCEDQCRQKDRQRVKMANDEVGEKAKKRRKVLGQCVNTKVTKIKKKRDTYLPREF